MGDMSFSWRGIPSDALGVVVTKLPPVMIPAKRDETIVVPGRSGALHRQDGAWDEMLLPVECYLPYEQGTAVASLETLAAWLTGAGWLTLSNRPNRRFYARLTDAVSLTPLMEGFADRIFSLSFWADPFAYLDPPLLYDETAPFSVTNPGTVFSEPVIEITATGHIGLILGDKIINIADVPGSAMIDVGAGLIYSGTTNLTGSAETDDWPLTLPTGTTAISWGGSVTRVKIQPNWRWL